LSFVLAFVFLLLILSPFLAVALILLYLILRILQGFCYLLAIILGDRKVWKEHDAADKMEKMEEERFGKKHKVEGSRMGLS